MNRAQSLKQETALNSITPERAGGIMYDTAALLNQQQLRGTNPLLISKIYASIEAMEADDNPVSDITGEALRAGQIVVISTSQPDEPDEGLVYRFNGIVEEVSSWTCVGKIGSSPYLEGYQFMGKAVLTPTPTDPGVPTQKVFYQATEPGTYTNFGGIVVADGEVVNLKWDGTAWSKEDSGVASHKKVFVSSFVGRDTTFVGVRLSGLIGGNRYRLYLSDPDFSRSNTTAGLSDPYILQVSYYKGGSKVDNLVDVRTSVAASPLLKYYDFTMPPAGEFDEIFVGGRANAGVEVEFTIVDITPNNDVGLTRLPITPNSLNYAINNDGTFGTSTTYKHAAIPVSEGEVYELTGEFNSMRYAFATSDSFSSGGDIPLVSGTRVMQMWQTNTPIQIIIPAGCNFLLFRTGNPFNPTCYKFVQAEYRDGTKQVFVGCGQTFVRARGYAIARLTPGKEYRIIIDSNLPADFDTGNTVAFGLYKLVGGTEVRVWSVTSSEGVPGAYDFTATADADCYYVAGRAPLGTIVRASIVPVEGLTGGTGILALNPDNEFYQKFVLAKKPNYNDPNETAPLVIAHISDVHGSFGRMGRFMSFVKHWKDKGYIDEILDTGDVVANTYSQGVASREVIDGIENVITLIGNHDTRASAEEMESPDYPAGQNQWQYHSNISLDPNKRRDTYLRYIVGPDANAPYVDSWGVTQPASAEANGYCYFYKDYATRKLRLIALDVMGYDATQHAWLQAVLSDAITNNLQVAILAHFCGELMTAIPCNYTSLFLSGDNIGTITLFNEDVPNIAVAVDAFQAAGGEFVCYITGHYHRDMVNVVKNYPKQLVLSVASGGITPTRDTTKVRGCRSNDDFQIVSINTYDKTVRLIKVGADRDYYSRKKGTACFGYDIINDGGTDKVRGLIGED